MWPCKRGLALVLLLEACVEPAARGLEGWAPRLRAAPGAQHEGQSLLVFSNLLSDSASLFLGRLAGCSLRKKARVVLAQASELQPEAQGDKKPETALSNLEPLGSMSSRLWERLVWLLGDSGENGSQR